ncbi:rCG30288, partial [Rattus norvegicus]
MLHIWTTQSFPGLFMCLVVVVLTTKNNGTGLKRNGGGKGYKDVRKGSVFKKNFRNAMLGFRT